MAFWNGYQRKPLNYWLCHSCDTAMQSERDRLNAQCGDLDEEDYDLLNYWCETYYVHSAAFEEDEGTMAFERYAEVF